MKNLVLIVDDKVGLMADISYILGKAKINIEGLHAATIGTKSVLTITVKDEKKARTVLEANGYKIMSDEFLVAKLPDQPGDVPRTFADVHKAEQLLGYHPQTAIREGVAKYVDWYRRTVLAGRT